MDNKKKFPVTNIGTVTLLMIFIILCMVTFAVLSLSEAAKDRSFSRQLADQTADYYAACGNAEKMLAEIDSVISDTKNSGLSGGEYYEAISEKLAGQYRVGTEKAAGDSGNDNSGSSDKPDANVEAYTASIKANEDTIFCSIPVNDRLVLAVSLQIAAPGETFSGKNYRILSWEETQSEEWNGSNSLELIQP